LAQRKFVVGYHLEMQPVTAFLLAGGKSTRMGQDKAFVEFQGKTLLDRALSLLRALTQDVVLVGSRDRLAVYGTVIEDVFPNAGPLGGIHAALRASQTDLNLLLAVDLPLVSPELLQYLVRRAEKTQALVTVPRTSDGWQPLCAVYRRAFADAAELALQQGRNKVDALFDLTLTDVVNEKELAESGFSPTAFRNINTPDDLGESG
jgi:molybdopterin-guanine dinucleotide biosynthesis protein A